MVPGKEEGVYLTLARVPAGHQRGCGQRWTPARSWRFLDDGVATTRTRTTRRVRLFDRHRGSCPDRGEGGDWRWQGAGELWPLIILLVSLRELAQEKCQGDRQRREMWQGKKGKQGSSAMSNVARDDRRCVGFPTSNLVALVMSYARIRKGVGGGVD
jgi:hypothetical protein